MFKDVLRLQFDIGLALGELGAGLALSRSVDHYCPQGSGAQPVMTIPGFTAPERSMAYMARFLNRNGFDAHSWGLGANRGPIETDFATQVEQLAHQMADRVQALCNQHGRGVALIGHSLGGGLRTRTGTPPDPVDRPGHYPGCPDLSPGKSAQT